MKEFEEKRKELLKGFEEFYNDVKEDTRPLNQEIKATLERIQELLKR